MKYVSYLILIILLIRCQPATLVEDNKPVISLSNSLIKDHIKVLGDSILFTANNDMLILAKKKPFSIKNEVLVNGKTSDSVSNFIISKGNYGLEQEYFLKLIPLYDSPDKKLTIGEYLAGNDQNLASIWETDLDTIGMDLFGNNHKVKSFFKIDSKVFFMNIIKKEGVFFRSSGGVYLWILNNSIFFIRNKKSNSGERIMFHVLQESGFVNLDFSWQEEVSDKLLLSKKYEVAEIVLPLSILNAHIRIGGYNAKDKRNIWAQEINMVEVYNNELLIFNNDIE